MLIFILFIKKNNMTQEEFLKKANEIYGEKYDYSKSVFLGWHTKVCVICPEHGEFWVCPSNHISTHNHCGCPKCAGKYRTLEEFIKMAKKIHGDKYDYSKVNFVNMQTKICIICPKHGDFWMTPNDHVHNRGCCKCGKEKLHLLFSKTNREFIDEATKVHGEKYDYSKVEYFNAKRKVCIICHEHGDFWITPDRHLHGGGCPICGQIHKSVDVLANILTKNKIKFEREKMFEWLNKQRLDFYLPEYNLAIEYQGEQHFKPVKYFGGEKRFIDRIERDERKYNICQQNGVQIIYVSFYKKAPNDIVKNEQELIKKIKIYGNKRFN